MPWKIVSNHPDCPSSKSFAVVKIEGNKKVGCHSSKALAKRQLAALNASESKDKNMDTTVMDFDKDNNVSSAAKATVGKDKVIINKEHLATEYTGERVIDIDKVYVPFNVVSFEEYDEMVSAKEAARAVQDDAQLFAQLIDNVMNDEETANKGTAIVNLANEFKERVSDDIDEADESNKSLGFRPKVKIFTNLKDKIFGKKKNPMPLMFWKDKNGATRWLTIYSNNYRDEDHPPEIISKSSHKRFVKMVDEGRFPMPSLMHWHIPGTEWGKADMVDYDKQTGFAVASGFVLPGHEKEAESVAKMKDIAVSHGMPPNSIKRSNDDPSTIIEHQTVEISVLPLSAAANKLTGFSILKETKMLSPEKRAFLEEANVPNDVLASVDKKLDKGKDAATEAQLESKETAQETPDQEVPDPDAGDEEVPDESPDEDDTDEDNTSESTPPFTESQANELKDAFQTQTDNLVVQIGDLIDKKINAKIDPLLKSEDERIKEVVKNTPAASLSDIIFGGSLKEQSALNSEETRVDGRHKLSKLKPSEKKVEEESVVKTSNGVLDGAINNIVNGRALDFVNEKE